MIISKKPVVSELRPGASTREFFRVENFESLQSPKRPKRPTWVKAYCRDLDLPEYTAMSLATRGFLCDFVKLAASLENRVPADHRFVARRLGIRPQDVGKAIITLRSLGYITGFVEDIETSRNNDLKQLTDAKGIPTNPASNSSSSSESGSASKTTIPNSTTVSDRCARCDGEGCSWCEVGAA